LMCLEFKHELWYFCCVFYCFDFLLNCFVFCLADLDDPQSTSSKQHTTDMSEGRITPTASSGMLIVSFILRIIIVNLFVVVQVQIRFFSFSLIKVRRSNFTLVIMIGIVENI
jgi:hypothetical protein